MSNDISFAASTLADVRTNLAGRADVPARLVKLRGMTMYGLLELATEMGINYDAPGNGNASKNDLAKQVYEYEQLREKVAAPAKISTDAFKPGIYRFHFREGYMTALGAIYMIPSTNQKFAQLVTDHCGTALEDLLENVVSYDFVCDR